MKLIGEAFFMKKGAEGARYKMYLNSQAKGLLPDRTLESFYYLKTPKVQFLSDRKFLLGRMTELSNFVFIGKISQVKRQSKKILIIFLALPFLFT
jgi:hypothetical protein